MKFLAHILLLLLVSAPAGAAELLEYYRGARPSAMGGAYVALADDENAVFLNPAGLAMNKEYRFHYLPLDITVSHDVVQSAQTSVGAFRSLSGDSVNILMGKNIFAGLQYTPMLLMDGFAIAGLVDAQFALYAKNKALPNVTLGVQQTNGIQLAYGFDIARKRSRTSHFNVGIGTKVLWRRGGYQVLPVSDLVSMSQDKLRRIVGDYSTIYAADLGLQYISMLQKQLQLSFGYAQTNLGFTTRKGVTQVDDGVGAVGAALQYKSGAMRYSVSYEYRHIFETVDWRKRLHLGMEVKMPILGVMLGVNQTYLSYGAEVDLWFIKIRGISYSEELGVSGGQEGMRKYTLSLNMSIPL